METKEKIDTKAEENLIEEKDVSQKRTVTFKIQYKTIIIDRICSWGCNRI